MNFARVGAKHMTLAKFMTRTENPLSSIQMYIAYKYIPENVINREIKNLQGCRT